MNISIKKLSLKLIVISLGLIFNITYSFAQTPFESDSRFNNNQSQTTDNSSNSSIWGENESTFFNNSDQAGSGTRANAPALPDEPGASCVPVPSGTLVLLGMAFIYSLVVLYKSKKEKMQN